MRFEAERVKMELEALKLERESAARAEEAERPAEEEASRTQAAAKAAEDLRCANLCCAWMLSSLLGPVCRLFSSVGRGLQIWTRPELHSEFTSAVLFMTLIVLKTMNEHVLSTI